MMDSIVYAPFVLSAIALALTATIAKRMPPRVAAWAISTAGAVLALSSLGALVLLACPLVARVPLVAAVGRWQPQSVALRSPTPVWLSALALGVLGWLGWRAAREVRRLARDLADVTASHADLARCGPSEVVVVDDTVPRAHAINRTLTRRGRVVITTAMWDVLDQEERAAVVAHERAHLRHGHGLFVAAMRMAATLNPLLCSLGPHLDFALERWADEDAAAATDRPIIASALAKAAIATLRFGVGTVVPAGLHLHGHAVAERVTALLDEPPSGARLAWAFLGVSGIAFASLLWAMHDTERFFEAVRIWQQQ
jgi:Zn-dependent protease with chaperone function